MKRRKRRVRHAGRRDAFHLTMIAVLMTVLCLMIVNIKEPEQTEEEQPETTHAEVVQNPETIVQTAEETESKYKVFDGMSEDWGSDDLEGFVLYKLPEQYADKGYFPEKMQIYTRCLCKQNDVPYALVLAIIERESGYEFDKVGDGGQSKGYMQIYEKWHTDRMERLSCTDLMNPYQNVRVGSVRIYGLKKYNRITGGINMKIIAVMSPKGGIGKTTTSDSIAYMLGEEQGKRVLVLDGDPQGDTSKTFGVYEPGGIGMSELLEKHECVGGTYKTGDLIRPTEYSHVDIIPANGYLMKTDMNLLLKEEDNQVTRLREALEEVADAYDYCICDCGRLLDMVVINILISAELIIAPVKVGGYEIEALQNLEEQIEDLRDINPDLRIKALMTMRQKNKTSLEVEEWLKADSGFDMFVTPVRRSIVAEKSTTAMIPLPKFSKRGIVSQDYRCVVHELLKEMEG